MMHTAPSWTDRYRRTRALFAEGNVPEAARLLRELAGEVADPSLRAKVHNDLAALAAHHGDLPQARTYLQQALQLDRECESAQLNLRLLDSEIVAVTPAPAAPAQLPQDRAPSGRAKRIAILSFLFNWPSTGGGIIHTVELGDFLQRAGYQVHHWYAEFPPWEIGVVKQPVPFPSQALSFVDADWHLEAIQDRFRRAVQAYGPDFVIITDSWNIKPLLAEAVAEFPYLLRLQALECLCPLNNARFLYDGQGPPRQCGTHQFAAPNTCRQCLRANARLSGPLHQAERELAGVTAPDYLPRLQRVFAKAHAVLVVNPPSAELLKPHVRDVRVVTAGMDPDRFPWPWPNDPATPRAGRKLRLLFAGLIHEMIKGFHIAEEACRLLWQERQDFELWATADPAGPVNAYTRHVGWVSQQDLARKMREADIVLVPAVWQEALGRTAVEAMAAGRPVIASKLGGLPTTVVDGQTGLLCEPSNAADLAAKIKQLLDDPDLCATLGQAGRKRFEEHYAWPVIIDRHYRPLLGEPRIEKPTRTPTESVPLPTATGLGKVGCVLAVRNRPRAIVERSLQTYTYQTVKPLDCVLLDYGSDALHAALYRELGATYGWRVVHVKPAEDRWQLTAAYNLAVSQLDPQAEIVFQGDTDLLMGPNVLELAARFGLDHFCQFAYITTKPGLTYPDDFMNPHAVHALFAQNAKTEPSVGQGYFACPRSWFHQVGGHDLQFRTWGYDDHDLRSRAQLSLPVKEIPWQEALLLHQWHPPSTEAGPAQENRAYFLRMRKEAQAVRNGGQLVPPGLLALPRETQALQTVAVVTRSLEPELLALSGRFLQFANLDSRPFTILPRQAFQGLEADEYFRKILALEADWVISLDEDAFLTDPPALVQLLHRMDQGGYAACGMPDGGVVPIRTHNPLACNAFFTIFDLRRCRSLLAEWPAVLRTPMPSHIAPLLSEAGWKSPFQLDYFEPYYGLFFALWARGEKILGLDADTWIDGTTTVLKTPEGQPFLYHAWFAREWQRDQGTKARYERLLRHVDHDVQSHLCNRSTAAAKVHVRTLVCVHVHENVENLQRWLRAWHASAHAEAAIAIVHSQNQPNPRHAQAILAGKPDVYLPRSHIGSGMGALQEVVQGTYADLLPDWDQLLWCDADFLPLAPTFLGAFRTKAASPEVGLVAGRFGYWPNPESGLDHQRYCREVGFLIKAGPAQRLRFPATPITTQEHCESFIRGPGHLLQQLIALGYQVVSLEENDAQCMWDTKIEAALQRLSEFETVFPA